MDDRKSEETGEAAESAEANWLLEDERPGEQTGTTGKLADRSGPAQPLETGAGYELIEPTPGDAERVRSRLPLRTPEVEPAHDEELADGEDVDVDVDVDVGSQKLPAGDAGGDGVEPWTRWKESGPNMVRGVVIGIAAYVGADLLGNLLGHGIGMLVMLGGLAAVLYQAYFLAITVERPVRMTPGRAVSDYLDALSHLMPHYKRMWLLLSNEGRDSVSSGDYERFVGYWQAHLGRLRGEQVPRWVPLHFEAGEIKCTKDRENSAARAKFQLQVFAASPRRSEPLDAWQVEVGLIKGRDGMWYLRRGDLLGAPGEPQEAGRAGGGDDEDVE